MTKSYTVSELAAYLNASVEGDGALVINSIADLKDAEASQISFLSSKQFESYLQSTKAGAVLLKEGTTTPQLEAASERAQPPAIIRVPDPYLAYAKLTQLFVRREPQASGIHPSAVIAESAVIAASARIGPYCVIEEGATVGPDSELQAHVFVGRDTVIGRGCRLYASVTLYHQVVLGDEVTIHSASVIGADGFGFAPSEQGWVKIHQLGSVVIGNRVEIGASSTIDRGAIKNTIIADGVIIDDQVHIAHNCELGEGTAVAGCSGIAGSTKVGKRCTLGGGVGVAGHIVIGDDVHFNGGSRVTKSVTTPGHYSSGTPIQDVKIWRKNAVRQGQLSEWVERIRKLEQSSKLED